MVELREKLLLFLEKQEGSISFESLMDGLGIDSTKITQRELVEETLQELEISGDIYRDKSGNYKVFSNASGKMSGIIAINKRGGGTILGTKITVSRELLNGAISGDRVIVSNNGGQKTYHVEKIVARGFGYVTCEISVDENGEKIVTPLSNNRTIKINVPPEQIEDFVDGDRIMVKVDPSGEDDYYTRMSRKDIRRNRDKAPIHNGTVIKRLGNRNDPDADIAAVANKHGFEPEYPEEVMKEVYKISMNVHDEFGAVDFKNKLIKDKRGQVRRDLRNKVIFTIDGDDTKDIDDAISLEILPNGNRLLSVHIADVSYYVKPGSALFEEARKRGTSLYILDKVIAMLPTKLSNGVCSLNENQDRLAKTCEMEIDSSGKIINSNVYHSVIKSRKKMTYNNVNKILEDGKIPEGYEDYAVILLEMDELAKQMNQRRSLSGKVNYTRNEAKTVTNSEGKIISVKSRVQGAGEKLIENFMVAANSSVARMFRELPFIFRVHDQPEECKFKNLFKKLANIFPSIKMPNKFDGVHIQEFLDKIRDRKEYGPVMGLLLRCTDKALYSNNNIGHYGLGIKFYTHFTSPIRRFSDLVVHNLIDLYLSKDFEKMRKDKEAMSRLKMDVAADALQASARELEGEQAEFEVLDMKLAEYMSNFIGQDFIGKIEEVSEQGMIVSIGDVIEGGVRMADVEGKGKTKYSKDFFLICKGDEDYTLGDEVVVRVEDTSVQDRRIRLRLLGHAKGPDYVRTRERQKKLVDNHRKIV